MPRTHVSTLVRERATIRSLRALTALHVDIDGAGNGHAEFRGATRHMRRLRARDQRLGRNAAIVDAGAAEMFALDEGDGLSGAGQPSGQGRPSAARFQ